ncbi:Maltose excess protein 1 chloroplastic [Zea mays]|uniref:Maltose excess protein 1 chloroplastic n=1 Tax=Zea mays TaxID=4577 RepID=A0A1D6F6D2_MAIZE|nr:Maltose excess protein 1 chloroplastic [Zea mays]
MAHPMSSQSSPPSWFSRYPSYPFHPVICGGMSHDGSIDCFELPVLGWGAAHDSKKYQQSNYMTAKFTSVANIPFLFLQLPRISSRPTTSSSATRPHSSSCCGSYGPQFASQVSPPLCLSVALVLMDLIAHFRVCSLGFCNLLPLSYFTKKRETEAVISTYAVLVQLAMAESMLVMWLTFVPFIHNSVLHGIISGSLAVAMMVSVPSYYGDAGAVAVQYDQNGQAMWGNKHGFSGGVILDKVTYGMVKEPVPMRPGPWGGEGGWAWDDWVYTGVKCCAESSCQDMQ